MRLKAISLVGTDGTVCTSVDVADWYIQRGKKLPPAVLRSIVSLVELALVRFTELEAGDASTFAVGSVSHGTMRAQDVGRAILDWMNNHAADTVNEYETEFNRLLNSDEVALNEFVFECLFDVMNALAPAGVVFGAHPGDGSDYGFWMDEVVY